MEFLDYAHSKSFALVGCLTGHGLNYSTGYRLFVSGKWFGESLFRQRESTHHQTTHFHGSVRSFLGMSIHFRHKLTVTNEIAGKYVRGG
jgi:hypothetical protein